MPVAEKRTIRLPPEQASYIDNLVANGGYASASEVVRAGLRALRERDEVIERWLRDEVMPTHERMKRDPGSAIPAEEVFARLRDRNAEMSGKAG